MELSFTSMVQVLQKRFPQLEVLDSNEFSKDTAKEYSIWLKNAVEVTYTNKDKNTLLASVNEPSSKLYEFDVYKKLENFCTKRGWYTSTESYTLQLFKL